MNEREKAVHAARASISDARLTAFLRAANTSDGDSVFAVKLINERLASDRSLDAIFYDGDGYGYSLAVESLFNSTYRIDFGCQAGPLAGDGGSWEVEFDGDSVQEITNRGIWIS